MSYSALAMHNPVKMHPHKRDTCAILALDKTGFCRISPKVCICYIYMVHGAGERPDRWISAL